MITKKTLKHVSFIFIKKIYKGDISESWFENHSLAT